MGIGTLAEVYNNRNVFHTNVKLRRGTTAKLVVETADFDKLMQLYYSCCVKIESKILPNDPSYNETKLILQEIMDVCMPHVPTIPNLAVSGPKKSRQVQSTEGVCRSKIYPIHFLDALDFESRGSCPVCCCCCVPDKYSGRARWSVCNMEGRRSRYTRDGRDRSFFPRRYLPLQLLWLAVCEI